MSYRKKGSRVAVIAMICVEKKVDEADMRQT